MMRAFKIPAILTATVLVLAGCAGDKCTGPRECGPAPDPNAPDVTLTSPNGGETFIDSVLITWLATDPDSGEQELLVIDLDYSDDGGATWSAIDSGRANDGVYLWDVSAFIDGTDYVTRVSATDTSGLFDRDISDAVFAIQGRIVIIDRTGKIWDITHAVTHFDMVPRSFAYGLGPFAIRPVINPDYHSPGDPGYPGTHLDLEVIGVSIDGDSRAYPTGALCSFEVVNDIVGGQHVAVTY
jgi:hypothetical protein